MAILIDFYESEIMTFEDSWITLLSHGVYLVLFWFSISV